jgi:hypothetical protein
MVLMSRSIGSNMLPVWGKKGKVILVHYAMKAYGGVTLQDKILFSIFSSKSTAALPVPLPSLFTRELLSWCPQSFPCCGQHWPL